MATAESPRVNSPPPPVSDDAPLPSGAPDVHVASDTSTASQPEHDATDQSAEPVARAADYWARLDKLIRNLEDRVERTNGIENHYNEYVEQVDEGSQEADSDSQQNDDADSSGGEGNAGLSPPFIPGVRYCNYHQFMNRYPDERAHAIEVLRAGNDIGKQTADEWVLRWERQVDGYYSSDRPVARRRGNNWAEDGIQRVRIRSVELTQVLGDVTNHAWGTKPVMFLRPFRYMIHFHQRFKDRLAQMEEEAAREGGSGQALEEMRCYVKFAEEEIVPLYYKFTDHDFDRPAKIRHHDLWYLFRPGELIYVPRDTLATNFATNSAQGLESMTSSAGNTRRAALQTLWKIAYAWPKHGSNFPDEETSGEDLQISAYYYDYDGSMYACVPFKDTFNIPWFEGEKDIRDLEFYPIRFARDWQGVLAEGRLWGERFTEYIETRHMFYSGWTVTQHPPGHNISSRDGNEDVVPIPEHIESDIIVDFQEVFNNCPGWKLVFFDDTVPGEGEYDTFFNVRDNVITWNDHQKRDYVVNESDTVVSEDKIHNLEHVALLSKDPFMRAKTSTSKPKPEGDDLALLPRRLFAYAIRDRKFVLVDLRYIKPVHKQSDVLDKLEIRADYKRNILALVRSTFRNKDLDKDGLLGTQDLIRGKGKGVVILLHGAPGVGKTATAEAVAQTFGRPLFPITCGDLGFAPDTVESSLSEIFRLAHLWNCVLLFDEADVFLTARSPTDIKRNALVSGGCFPPYFLLFSSSF